MNALRIYTTVSKTRNVSMRVDHFIVIVILGILKTATAAKVISISIPVFNNNMYSLILKAFQDKTDNLFISLYRVFRGWMLW